MHCLAAFVAIQGRVRSVLNRGAPRVVCAAWVSFLFAVGALAEPRAADAALELQLFLRMQEEPAYRVLSFDVLDARKEGEVRRVITYRARLEFPTGLNPGTRAVLMREKIAVQQGDIEALSSRKIVLDLERDAMFVRKQERWAVQVGTTRYPLPR
jgi:hypothetical protein